MTLMTKLAVILGALALTSCQRAANVASYNLSEAADNFQILRKVVFYNSITDTYIAEFEGYCSIADQGHQVEVTCRTGKDQYVKHFQGLSDNVTYTALQIENAKVSEFHSVIRLRPATVIPDVQAD